MSACHRKECKKYRFPTILSVSFFSKITLTALKFQTIEELEKEMLNGQKLQGPQTAEEVNYMLKNKGMEDR